MISTAGLCASLRLHPRPIDQIVCLVPYWLMARDVRSVAAKPFFLPFVGLRALRFVRSCEAVHAALSLHSLLHASSSSLGASSPHHSQCIRGRSAASVASVVVVASVVSVTFVPSVASVLFVVLHCPLLEKNSNCGQSFVRFSPKNKNADIPLVDGAAF